MQQPVNKAPEKKESRIPQSDEYGYTPITGSSPYANQHPLQTKVSNSSTQHVQQKKINNLQHAIQKKQNKTGLPDNLKTGLENLSGYDLSHVNVHFNSSRPAQLNALAYAQGSDIHLGPGQQKHLPHEGWHIVQQMQGRVKPTLQMKAGIAINDDAGLEKEADSMGAKALQLKPEHPLPEEIRQQNATTPVQMMADNPLASHVEVTFSEPQQLPLNDNEIIQRLVVFDESTGTIIKIIIKRPTAGLQSSKRKKTNYHTAAIIIAQDMLQTNLIGLTYLEALDFIANATNDIVVMPGFRFASKQVQMQILELIDKIHILHAEDAYESSPMNWASYLEILAELYVQTIDQLDYTYHEKGSGKVGGEGEGSAADKLRGASLGKDLDEKSLLVNALKLIDLRNWSPTSPEKGARLVAQYIQKIMVAYPIFIMNEYLRTALITEIAKQVKIDPGTLFKLVDKLLFIPDMSGDDNSSSSSSEEIPELDLPTWDGRTLPHEAYMIFIKKGIRVFTINGMRLRIVAYKDNNVQFRIGPRGG